MKGRLLSMAPSNRASQPILTVSERRRQPAQKFVIAVDVSGSTAFTRACSQLGVEHLFGQFMVKMAEDLVMAEQAGQWISGCTSGIDVSNFTGDGFLVTCDDEQAARAVIGRICLTTLGQLRDAALTHGVGKEYTGALHIRTAVTYGQVFPAEIPVTRPCDAACLADLQQDTEALKQFVDDGKGLPMKEDVRLRAHFGLAVNRAFRLLDTCPARCRYRVVIHESAWPALDFGEGHDEISWPVRDFGTQTIYGIRKKSHCPAPLCGNCPVLAEEQEKQSELTRRDYPCSFS